MLAEDDEQVKTYRRGAAGILDQAFGGSYAPFVAVRPRAPSPELTRLMLELYGLSEFDNIDIKDVGKDQYDDRKRRTLQRLAEILKELDQTGEYEVPQLFRARVLTVAQRLRSVLPEVLQTAYHQGPREFFGQYKLTQPKLRTSVAKVGNHLSDNTLDTPKAFGGDPIAQQIVDLFLRNKWSVANTSQLLRAPAQGSPLYPGWKALDDHFEAGAAGTKVGGILFELLNPPYGYDYNTLTLLFAAWYGYNRHDIQLSCTGRLTTLGEVARDYKKGLKPPKDFLTALSDCTVTRRDRSQLTLEVEKLLRKVDTDTFSKSEASDGIRKLQDFLEDEHSDPDLRPEVKSAAEALRGAVKAADEYNQKAASLSSRVERKRKVGELVDLMVEITRLPHTSRVKPDEPGPEELRKVLSRKVTDLTEARCVQLEQIANISEYGLHYQELQTDRQVLSKIGVARLVERVDLALQTLEERKEALDHGQKDAVALGVLAAIPTKGNLSSLREHHLTVSKLEFLSAEAKQEAQAKSEAIQSEIVQLEAFARGLAERLGALLQRNAVQSLKEDILRRRDSFEGTEEQHGIEQSLERCEMLGGYFARLYEARNLSPKNPEEANEQIENLDRLGSEYQEVLSSVQLDVLKEVEEATKQKVARRTEQALTWLESFERDLNRLSSDGQNQSSGSKLEDLLGRLKDSPPFLPLEAQSRLDKCQREVQQLADQDQSLQVELHFRQIADRHKQLECLERLKQLLRET